MPYTLAHPALVVPLRRWVVLGAAVAGALAPDTAYYLPPWSIAAVSYPGTDVTHSLLGAAGLDAAVGLVLWLLWRWPLRPALLGSLPAPWRDAALAATRDVLPGRSVPVRVLLLYASSAIGALSHVALDVLTHDRPDTPEVLVDERVLGLPIASQLQRGLSVVGLALLAWWIWRWLAGVAPLRTFRLTGRLVGLLTTAAVGALAVTARHLATTPLASRSDALIQTLVGLTEGAALGLLVAALVLVARPAPS